MALEFERINKEAELLGADGLKEKDIQKMFQDVSRSDISKNETKELYDTVKGYFKNDSGIFFEFNAYIAYSFIKGDKRIKEMGNKEPIGTLTNNILMAQVMGLLKTTQKEAKKYMTHVKELTLTIEGIYNRQKVENGLIQDIYKKENAIKLMTLIENCQ